MWGHERSLLRIGSLVLSNRRARVPQTVKTPSGVVVNYTVGMSSDLPEQGRGIVTGIDRVGSEVRANVFWDNGQHWSHSLSGMESENRLGSFTVEVW